MKAMILAAGRGNRMAPLTDTCPKPLLKVAGKPLIIHHIERLKRAGITRIVINVSYLADQLMHALGDGSALGVSIEWSHEPEALETAGGIRHALPLLGDAPFLLVNGDIWTDFDFTRLIQQPLGNDLGRLVMIPQAEHNPKGDFHLDDLGRLQRDGEPRQVYGCIALLAPDLVRDIEDGSPAKLLGPLLAAIDQQRLGGILFNGDWVDVGTPERLAALDARL